MTLFDYAVLLIVGLSVVLSVWRGAVREILSLAAWVAAFWAAGRYAHSAAAMLPQAVAGESLRLLVAFAGVFILVWLLLGAVAWVASTLVKSAGLGLADRMVGAVFGLARGVLIVMALVLAAGLTVLPKNPMWRHAVLSPPLEAFAVYLKIWLPKELAGRISYE